MLINCKAGFRVEFEADVVTGSGVEVTFHIALLVVVLICTGTAVRPMGNLHKAPVVQ